MITRPEYKEEEEGSTVTVSLIFLFLFSLEGDREAKLISSIEQLPTVTFLFESSVLLLCQTVGE